MLESLQKDFNYFNYFAKTVRLAIWAVSKRRYTKTVRFGRQQVQVAAQAYCGGNYPIPVSELLSRILFSENYSKTEKYKTYKNRSIFVFAISSLE